MKLKIFTLFICFFSSSLFSLKDPDTKVVNFEALDQKQAKFEEVFFTSVYRSLSDLQLNLEETVEFKENFGRFVETSFGSMQDAMLIFEDDVTAFADKYLELIILAKKDITSCRATIPDGFQEG